MIATDFQVGLALSPGYLDLWGGGGGGGVEESLVYTDHRSAHNVLQSHFWWCDLQDRRITPLALPTHSQQAPVTRHCIIIISIHTVCIVQVFGFLASSQCSNYMIAQFQSKTPCYNISALADYSCTFFACSMSATCTNLLFCRHYFYGLPVKQPNQNASDYARSCLKGRKCQNIFWGDCPQIPQDKTWLEMLPPAPTFHESRSSYT